jgi:hypothetical protein
MKTAVAKIKLHTGIAIKSVNDKYGIFINRIFLDSKVFSGNKQTGQRSCAVFCTVF